MLFSYICTCVHTYIHIHTYVHISRGYICMYMYVRTYKHTCIVVFSLAEKCYFRKLHTSAKGYMTIANRRISVRKKRHTLFRPQNVIGGDKSEEICMSLCRMSPKRYKSKFTLHDLTPKNSKIFCNRIK